MTTMLERMAKASYEANDAAPPWEPDTFGWQKVYINRMRAALQTIRHPSGPALGAAWSALPDDHKRMSTGDLSDSITAMIDAILTERPGPTSGG